MELEAAIDRLPIDLLAHIFVLFTSFTDLAQAGKVCKKWKQGVKESLARKQNLSFAGWKMDDDSTSRLVSHAYNLRKLDIPRSRWSCQITDAGLIRISYAKCIGNLTSISLWGLTGITDEGVVQLISRTRSLRHLNVGGTFITNEIFEFDAMDEPPSVLEVEVCDFDGPFGEPQSPGHAEINFLISMPH
ncbi:hypothetical protein RYX36_014619 [Vicia faba]